MTSMIPVTDTAILALAGEWARISGLAETEAEVTRNAAREAAIIAALPSMPAATLAGIRFKVTVMGYLAATYAEPERNRQHVASIIADMERLDAPAPVVHASTSDADLLEMCRRGHAVRGELKAAFATARATPDLTPAAETALFGEGRTGLQEQMDAIMKQLVRIRPNTLQGLFAQIAVLRGELHDMQDPPSEEHHLDPLEDGLFHVFEYADLDRLAARNV